MEKIKKQCEVVKLYTDDVSNIWEMKIGQPLYDHGGADPHVTNTVHLYIISGGSITTGDWVYSTEHHAIFQIETIVGEGTANATYSTQEGRYACYLDEIFKIAGTTDYGIINTTSEVGKISKQFQKKYCEMGGIDSVMVEFEVMIAHDSSGDKIYQVTPYITKSGTLTLSKAHTGDKSTAEHAKQFGLWLGANFKRCKNKNIDLIYGIFLEESNHESYDEMDDGKFEAKMAKFTRDHGETRSLKDNNSSLIGRAISKLRS